MLQFHMSLKCFKAQFPEQSKKRYKSFLPSNQFRSPIDYHCKKVS